mgnify:CR=1 FL=1
MMETFNGSPPHPGGAKILTESKIPDVNKERIQPILAVSEDEFSEGK